MKMFKDADHDNFINWIEKHPEGFFINRKGHRMIHRAHCSQLKPYEGVNQTSNSKICSMDKQKLEGWAESEGVKDLEACRVCM